MELREFDNGQWQSRIDRINRTLASRPLVLVGMMGSGKSSIGRRLAQIMSRKFFDSDNEIERAANCRISEIFSKFGERYFRDRERQVIERLLKNDSSIIATGGGAFINSASRECIARRGISIWLRADIPVLLSRVEKRSHRPLLHGQDQAQILRQLMDERGPVYALADITVESIDIDHIHTIKAIIGELERQFDLTDERSHG